MRRNRLWGGVMHTVIKINYYVLVTNYYLLSFIIQS